MAHCMPDERYASVRIRRDPKRLDIERCGSEEKPVSDRSVSQVSRFASPSVKKHVLTP
jgi:hypothetical protein